MKPSILMQSKPATKRGSAILPIISLKTIYSNVHPDMCAAVVLAGIPLQPFNFVEKSIAPTVAAMEAQSIKKESTEYGNVPLNGIVWDT